MKLRLCLRKQEGQHNSPVQMGTGLSQELARVHTEPPGQTGRRSPLQTNMVPTGHGRAGQAPTPVRAGGQSSVLHLVFIDLDSNSSSLTYIENLGKLVNLSKPQLPHL